MQKAVNKVLASREKHNEKLELRYHKCKSDQVRKGSINERKLGGQFRNGHTKWNQRVFKLASGRVYMAYRFSAGMSSLCQVAKPEEAKNHYSLLSMAR